jgi:predicted O-methyltransferase YrrM
LRNKTCPDSWIEIEETGKQLLKNKQKRCLIRSIENKNYNSVSEKVGHILYNLVKHYNICHIVEFGTSIGIYTAYMAKANPHATIFSVEISPDIAKTASLVFGQLNLINVELININYDTAITHFTDKFKNTDLFFINGNHFYGSVMRYFNYMKMYVKENSMVVISKIHWSKEMEKVWKKIQSDMDVRIAIDLYDIGIVFFRKGIVKQNFILQI